MNFWETLIAIKNWKKVSREGWNWKGLYISLQTPTKLSKMTRPYIFITCPAGNWGYKKEELIPWLASQSDLLSEDWNVLN